MYFREETSRFCAVLCIWTNFALGGDKSTWSIQQFDGLDDLYLETEKAAPVTPDYALIKTVCDEIKKMDSFHAIEQDANDFHTNIRGRLEKMKHPPLYVVECGCRRYKLKTKKSSFIIDLYKCTDSDTNETELKGLVKRDPVPGEVEGLALVEAEGRPQEEKLEIKLQENPVCDVNVLQKLQACLLLLNTPYYRNKYILSLSFANVNQTCKRVIVETDWGSNREKVERYAFPCWVTPVSNPWLKFINIPDEPSRPLYLFIDYKKLTVHTYRTVEQGEEFDIVHFDANLRSLLLNDLFFILKQAALGLKKLSRIGSKKDDS